jgi:hypothetical protein
MHLEHGEFVARGLVNMTYELLLIGVGGSIIPGKVTEPKHSR